VNSLNNRTDAEQMIVLGSEVVSRAVGMSVDTQPTLRDLEIASLKPRRGRNARALRYVVAIAVFPSASTLFGMAPAKFVARLDPVASLRHE
jgi:hypothetical protein